MTFLMFYFINVAQCAKVIAPLVMTKRLCTTCLSEEPDGGFRNGLTCHECEQDYLRNYAKLHKEHLADYKKLWAKNNRASGASAARAYRQRKKDGMNVCI